MHREELSSEQHRLIVVSKPSAVTLCKTCTQLPHLPLLNTGPNTQTCQHFIVSDLFDDEFMFHTATVVQQKSERRQSSALKPTWEIHSGCKSGETPPPLESFHSDQGKTAFRGVSYLWVCSAAE